MARLSYNNREKIARYLFAQFGPLEPDEYDEDPGWDEVDDEERDYFFTIVNELLAMITEARKRKPPQMKE